MRIGEIRIFVLRLFLCYRLQYLLTSVIFDGLHRHQYWHSQKRHTHNRTRDKDKVLKPCGLEYIHKLVANIADHRHVGALHRPKATYESAKERKGKNSAISTVDDGKRVFYFALESGGKACKEHNATSHSDDDYHVF